MITESIPPQFVITYGEDNREVGQLDAVLWPGEAHYSIADIFVDRDFRGRGIAKAILYLARQQAVDMGARSIGARIVSREGINVMRAVFGDDSVTVSEEGHYHPPNVYDEDIFDANALLHHELGY